MAQAFALWLDIIGFRFDNTIRKSQVIQRTMIAFRIILYRYLPVTLFGNFNPFQRFKISADLKPLEWVEIPEQCNWKVSVENYSECYHCALNHLTFSNGVVKPETYDIQPQGKCLRHTTECQNLDSMSYDIHSGFAHFDEYSSWYLWPLFSFQVYPGNVLNTYHWRAHGPDQVMVWRGWYSVDGVEDEKIRKLAVQDRQTTVEEDIHLVESVQRGLRSRGYRPGPLVIDPNCGVNSEHPVMHLQNWMRQAADESL